MSVLVDSRRSSTPKPSNSKARNQTICLLSSAHLQFLRLHSFHSSVSTKEDSDPATTYSYDASGKIIKVSNLYGYGNGTFTYQAGSVSFNNSTDGSTQTFNIDGSGRIVLDRFDTYKYNADGYLIEKLTDQLRPHPILNLPIKEYFFYEKVLMDMHLFFSAHLPSRSWD